MTKYVYGSFKKAEKNDYIAVSYEYSCMKGVFKKKNFRE